MRWVICGLIGGLLGWISRTDYRQKKIGKTENLVLFILGTGWVICQKDGDWSIWQGLGGMAVCGGIPELLNASLFDYHGLGGGDVRFLLAMGWTLGVWDGLHALLLACIAVMCWITGEQLAEIRQERKKYGKNRNVETIKNRNETIGHKKVALGPFLSVGMMAELIKQLIGFTGL